MEELRRLRRVAFEDLDGDGGEEGELRQEEYENEEEIRLNQGKKNWSHAHQEDIFLIFSSGKKV